MNLGFLFDSSFLIWIAFLGIFIPIFTFGVSLMLNAIEKAKEEITKSHARIKKRFNEDIVDLENKLGEKEVQDQVKESQRIGKELEKIKLRQKKFEKETDIMLKRYDILNFRHSVIMPGFFIICAIVFSILITICVIPETVIITYFFAVLFLIVALNRIRKCLNVIKEARLKAERYEQESIAKTFQRSLLQSDDTANS